MDMKTSICSYGAAETILNDGAMIALAHYYNLPVFCTAGCSDAQVFDQQAGIEAGFSILLLGLAGGNLIHNLGYIGAGMTSSLEMLVLGNETGAERDRDFSPNKKAIELIKSVGPGRHFLTENHTLEHFRTHLSFSGLMNRYNYDRWKETGAMDFGQRANSKVREILETHEVESLPPDIIKKIQSITAELNSKSP